MVFWGTYDSGKPRIKQLLQGLHNRDIDIIECHTHVWKGVKDKATQLTGGKKIRYLFNWILAYPSLICRYLRVPSHDVVIISFPGMIDAIVIWLFTRIRGVPIIWDCSSPVYDTTVNDRHLFSKRSPFAWFLYLLDWTASRLADQIVLETKTYAQYFEKLFKLPSESVERVFLGANTSLISQCKIQPDDTWGKKSFVVLFYGLFGPLQGIEVIIEAAKKVELSGEDIHWIIIGDGQERVRIEALMQKLQVKSIEWILDWMPFNELISRMKRADACLGIFSASGRAHRVIPFKVFEAVAAKRPVITADTPAIRELFKEGPCIRLVKPGDPQALASAVLKMKAEKHGRSLKNCENQDIPIIGQNEVGKQMEAIIEKVVKKSNK